MFLRLFAPACAVVACLLLSNPVNAQTDSAYLDLGRVKLPKNLTQNVTVKGDDLQKFPFTNLTDAVNVWFNGYLNNTTSPVYVIDGNIATDVNQYPVYDIEEVTLVQNALAQVNGANRDQQLILIKTKRHYTGNQGLMVAGQTNLVQLQHRGVVTYGSDNVTSNTKLYQQYHISAYKNINQLHVGLSANYLRDAAPVYTNSLQPANNPTTNRWRFNGYLNAPLWKGTTVDATAGYAPQTNDQYFNAVSNSILSSVNYNGNENLFNSTLKLNSQIISGLTNEVRAVYNRYDNDANSEAIRTFTIPQATYIYNTSNSDIKQKNFSLYDNLRYSYTAGNFVIAPAVNFNYRSFNTSAANFYTYSTQTSTGSSPVPTAAGSSTSYTSVKTYLLTPALNVDYKSLFNLTGGLVYILNSSNNSLSLNNDRKKAFPFVTASADVARLIDPSSSMSVKAYGSYSLSSFFSDASASFTNAIIAVQYGSNNLYTYNYATLTDAAFYTYKRQFKTLSLGADAGFFNNKLILSYNFENRKSYSPIIVSSYNNNIPYNYTIFTDTKYITHRVSAGFNFVNQKDFTLKSMLNASNLKQEIELPNGFNAGIINLDNKLWTGGWVNRLQYKNVTAGIDVLYLFAKNINTMAENKNLNSFSLQNVYAGLQLKTGFAKTFEVFANGRNLIQNDKSIFTDYRRYFGLGLKAGF